MTTSLSKYTRESEKSDSERHLRGLMTGQILAYELADREMDMLLNQLGQPTIYDHDDIIKSVKQIKQLFLNVLKSQEIEVIDAKKEGV